MATDRLINQTQGEDIIDQLTDIATKVGAITYGPQTTADKVVAMTGYAKASTEAAISQGDTLNEAVGKLEKKADDALAGINDKVSGPESSTTGAIATYSDATGDVLANSGVTIATSVTDSDTAVPTSKAVQAYNASTEHTYTFDTGTDNGTIKVTPSIGGVAGTAQPVAVKGLAGAAYKGVDTTVPASGATDNNVPTTAAVKTALDAKVAGPGSSTIGAIATYSDATGKVLTNSGITIANSEATSIEGDGLIPTGMAVTNFVMGVAAELSDDISAKLDATANAASAAKLNNGTSDYEVGSATKGVYFDDGIPKAMTCSVESNVPQNAVFTDTTYSNGTGITIGSGNVINHSNSITASGTTAAALKIKYDAQGHITGSGALSASDIGLGSTGTAVTGVSTTATSTSTGYIGISSYNSTTKTLTIKGILAPTASTFVKTS